MEKDARQSWETLFDKAMSAIDSLQGHLPSPFWTLGGGTVLMFHYQHRQSKDIDIFLTDAQFLTSFSPRLNDRIADLTKRYNEDSQHVKLVFPEGEVDFVVAPRLVDHSTKEETIRGRTVHLDEPIEIIAKKCFYRADYFMARDVFDLAVFLEKTPDTARRHLDILLNRASDLAARIRFYQGHPDAWQRDIQTIQALPGFSSTKESCLETVARFVHFPTQTLDRLAEERGVDALDNEAEAAARKEAGSHRTEGEENVE